MWLVAGLVDIFFVVEIALLAKEFPVDTPYLYPLTPALWMTGKSSERTWGWR
jgi:hypothetical protein